MNISDHELQLRHEEVPADYYDQGIISNPFQRIWHRRRRLIVERLLSGRGARLLDLGCHSGYLTAIIKEVSGAEVSGMDISTQAVEVARKRLPGSRFVIGDLQGPFPFPDGNFETVTAFDVLEHVPRLEQTLKEIHRVLVVGGSLVVGVPRNTVLFRLVWRAWTRFRGAVWRDVHVHDFNVPHIRGVVSASGFKETRHLITHWGMYLSFDFRKT